jgi:hypothetical protein
MINDRDQEQIYKLYEDFRGIELSQHPNNSNASWNYDRHNSTAIWDGLRGIKSDRFVPSESEEEKFNSLFKDSPFKYKLKSSPYTTFALDNISNDRIYTLRSSKGGIVKLPEEKFKHLFEEI